MLQTDKFQQVAGDASPLRPGQPVGAGEEVEILEAGQVLVEAEEVRHPADQSAHRPRFGDGVVTEDRGRAPVGAQQRRQREHRRGLAGAVGPDQPEDRARGNVEVQAVDGVELAVALGQPAHDHCWLPHGRPDRLRLGGRHRPASVSPSIDVPE